MESVNILVVATLSITGTIMVGLCMFYWKEEKKIWNKGKCPDCKCDWELTGIDYNGDRLYSCKNNHRCKISYHDIDKLGKKDK